MKQICAFPLKDSPWVIGLGHIWRYFDGLISWSCSSVVELSSSMCKILCSIPNTTKRVCVYVCVCVLIGLRLFYSTSLIPCLHYLISLPQKKNDLRSWEASVYLRIIYHKVAISKKKLIVFNSIKYFITI
jgi:hypothetical protein